MCAILHRIAFAYRVRERAKIIRSAVITKFHFFRGVRAFARSCFCCFCSPFYCFFHAFDAHYIAFALNYALFRVLVVSMPCCRLKRAFQRRGKWIFCYISVCLRLCLFCFHLERIRGNRNCRHQRNAVFLVPGQFYCSKLPFLLWLLISERVRLYGEPVKW